MLAQPLRAAYTPLMLIIIIVNKPTFLTKIAQIRLSQ